MFVARDTEGTLIWANEANKQTDYFCPVCSGKLILRAGEVNAHHFAHERTTFISIGSARCQSCASDRFRSRTVSMLGSVSAFISAQLKPVKTSLNTQFAVSTGHMLTT